MVLKSTKHNSDSEHVTIPRSLYYGYLFAVYHVQPRARYGDEGTPNTPEKDPLPRHSTLEDNQHRIYADIPQRIGVLYNSLRLIRLFSKISKIETHSCLTLLI